MTVSNRRAMLGLALAAASLPLAAPPASADPNPDVELLRLGDEWRQALAAEEDANAAYDEAEERYQAIAPARPASLIVRRSDIFSGLAPPAALRVFTPDQLPQIWSVHADRLSAPDTAENRAVIDRCAELAAAISADHAARIAADEASGYSTAEANLCAAVRRAQELTERLADLPAHTLAGVRLKAQVALSVADPDDTFESRIFLATFRQLAEIAQ